jgi:hypothetical protein
MKEEKNAKEESDGKKRRRTAKGRTKKEKREL